MKSSKDVSIILRWQYCHLFFTQMAADSIVFIVFVFFIWISYFQIHTTVALRRLVSLASCVSLKVRYEEIVKAICQGGYIMTYDDFTKQDLILLVSNLIDGLMQDDEEQAMIYLRDTCGLDDEQLEFFGEINSSEC